MTQVNRGRAFYSEPGQLGSYVMVDYLAAPETRRMSLARVIHV